LLSSKTLLSQILAGKIIGADHVNNTLRISPDHIYGHDRNTFKIIHELSRITAESAAVPDPHRIKLFMDHYSPPPSEKEALLHDEQRAFAKQTGCHIYDERSGIGHQIALEEFISTGDIAVGIDTHTCSVGALGAFGWRCAQTVVAHSIAKGYFDFMVPQIIKVQLKGSLNGLCTGNEIMFELSKYGIEKFMNAILEFGGEGLKKLTIGQRITIANLAYDLNARSVIMETDEITFDYLNTKKGRSYKKLTANLSDYDEVIGIDLDMLSPSIAFPGNIFNVQKLSECHEKIPVNLLVLGTCTNGRIEDYQDFLKYFTASHLPEGLRLHVIVSSRNILLELLNTGLYKAFVELGAVINPPGCGSCMGLHQGVLSENDVCVITGSRNNKGRMGAEDARIFLANPRLLGCIANHGFIHSSIIH
ncbi:MAG: aconitase family protein, partial [Chitinophagaceae bacterium]